MPRPSLAIVLRVQQSIDEFFIGLRIGIIDECLSLFRSGRQTDQVEVKSTNQCATIGFVDVLESLLLQPLEDERVNRGSHPGIAGLRDSGPFNRLERPPVEVAYPRFFQSRFSRPIRATTDPLADGFYFRGGKRIGVFGH